MDSSKAAEIATNKFITLKQQAPNSKKTSLSKLPKAAAKKTQEEVELYHRYQRKSNSKDLFSYDRFLLFTCNINSYGEWDIIQGFIFAFDDLKLLETFKINKDPLLR